MLNEHNPGMPRWPKCPTITLDNLNRLLILIMLSTFGWVWDFSNPLGQYQRTGRVKALLFAAVLLLAIRIGRAWHWSVGLLYAYILAIHIQQGMPAWGTLEMVTITAVLCLVPEMKRLVSPRAFESIILLSAFVHSLFGIMNVQGMYPILPMKNPEFLWPEYFGTPIGLLAQVTLLAPYLVFAFSISFYRLIESRTREETILYTGASILFLAITIRCGSTMGYLSLAAAMFVFALFYWGLWKSGAALMLLCLVGLASLYFNSKLGSFSGRLEPWNDAWSLIKIKPWFGYGIGSWSAVAAQIARAKNETLPWAQLHNEYLQGLFELGVAGMSLVAALLLRVAGKIHFLYLFKEKEMVPYIAGIAIFLANFTGNFTLHVVPHGALFAYCAYVVLKREN